jgi:small GTP-binding protein
MLNNNKINMENEEKKLDEDRSQKLIMKILLIGDTKVGKTSLIMTFTEQTFCEKYISTIGIEYKDKNIMKNGYKINLKIWDTAGQERFNALTKTMYRNVNGVLYVCDITNKESFDGLKNWIKNTYDIAKDIKGIIVGNKTDLGEERVVSEEDIKEFAENKNMPYIETSAKTGANVNKSFDLLVEELIKDKTYEQLLKLYGGKPKNCEISAEPEPDKKISRCC